MKRFMAEIDKRNCTKADFPKTEEGKTIFASVKDIADWVYLGFKEQEETLKNGGILNIKMIDLSNCELSYQRGLAGFKSKAFYLSDLADIVPGIRKKEDGNSKYQIEIDYYLNLNHSTFTECLFHYVHIKRTIDFSGCKIEKKFHFFECEFDDLALFTHANFSSDVSFIKCIFNNGVNFNELELSESNIKWENSKIKGLADFSGIKIGKEETDNESSEAQFKFEKVLICGKLLLSSSKIENKLLFEYCDLTGMEINDFNCNYLAFNECRIAGLNLFSVEKASTLNLLNNVIINGCTISGEIHLEKCKMKDFQCEFTRIEIDGRIRISESDIKYLVMKESSVYGRFDLFKCELKKINLDSTRSSGLINVYHTNLEKIESRYTARLLKDEALKVNDTLTSFEMYKEEMFLYEKELRSKLKKKTDTKWFPYIKQLLHYFSDLLILWFGRFSNVYGLRWTQGVLFTVSVSVFFFFLINYLGTNEQFFYITGNFENFGGIMKDYLKILNVFNVFDLGSAVLNFQLNAFGELLFLLSKIFISYGAYQTAVAFRKFSKSNN